MVLERNEHKDDDEPVDEPVMMNLRKADGKEACLLLVVVLRL